MNIIFFDTEKQLSAFYPLTFSRPLAALRCGILTLAEKWKNELRPMQIGYLTLPHLSRRFPFSFSSHYLYINPALLIDNELVERIKNLKNEQALYIGSDLAVLKTASCFIETSDLFRAGELAEKQEIQARKLRYLSDIFTENGAEIRADFKRLTAGRESQKITEPATVIYNPENVFCEEGVEIKAAIIDASSGPVYLGKNTKISPGSIVLGPFALGENSVLNLGAKMRENCSIGPVCKVGGECKNVVFQGFSNKAHEGYLGNSVVGEWCNFGAGTNVSNLKNNWSEIRLWDYETADFRQSDLRFCGAFVGDHVKLGINTMLNTGTVIGPGANVFGGGFPPKFIPAFSWGGAAGFQVADLQKTMKTAEIMALAAGKKLAGEAEIMEFAFAHDAVFRGEN